MPSTPLSVRVLKTLACAGSLAALLSACAPDLGPKPSLAAPSTLRSETSLAAPAADWPAEDWWKAYGDAELDRLIADGLKTSPTVREAAGRLRAARAYSDEAAAAGRPILYGKGALQDYLQSKNLGFPPFIQPLLPGSFHPMGLVNLDLSYDLDLFGKQKALVAAASSEAQAAQADYAEARLVLSTAIAAAYADLRRLETEKAVAEDQLRLSEETVALVAARAENGVETRAELKTRAINIPAARLELDNLNRQIALGRNQLAALMGRGPDDGLSIRPAAEGPRLSAIALPENLPANLLGRRPDIVAARLRAKAALKRVTAANADFYPNVNLTAVAGYQSLGLENMFKQASRYGQFGPALTLPIYTGGSNGAAYKSAFGQAESAAAAYDQTLTLALKDVADALVNRRSVEAQLVDARQALDHAREAEALTNQRVEAGIANRLAVLGAHGAVLAQARTVADLENLAFAYDVALVRALGGGYAEPSKIAKR